MANPKNVNDHVNLNGGFTGHNNPGAAVWYVGATTALNGSAPSDNNNGTSPQQAFSTIQKGLDSCVGGRGDIVALLPGSYTVTAAITMSKADVTLQAAHMPGPRQRSNVVIVNATDVNTIEITASDVTVAGIEFDDNVSSATADTAVIAANVANTGADLRNVKIINCFLDMLGSDADRDGIALGLAGDADDGAIGSLVEGCVIFDCDQDAIVLAAGSDYSRVVNCEINDVVNLCRYGVEVAAVGCVVSGCDILVSDTATPGAPIHNGVAAARLQVNDCRLHAWGANTTGILAINTATQRSAGNFITATAAGNVIDYLTASTSPSAAADIGAVYAADPPAAALVVPTVAGS